MLSSPKNMKKIDILNEEDDIEKNMK